jgi:xanthine/uracil permease
VAFKYLIVVILILIVASLAKALFHLSRTNQKDDGRAMARALTWRIALSVLLFVLLIVAYYQGWIHPG